MTWDKLATLARISFREAIAYRAELFVWILSTTMPFVMLALFSALAKDGNVGRFGEHGVVAYFLLTFSVRQLTGSWIAWQMNMEVRQGTLSVRLLRPVSPVFHYALENLAAVPLRLFFVVPVSMVLAFGAARSALTSDPVLWIVFAASIVLSYLLTFFANVIVGALSFYADSSIKIIELYWVIFFVASGYTIPISLFPQSVQRVLDYLPFRYQLGFPVEVAMGHFSRVEALERLGYAAFLVAACFFAATTLFRRGTRRYGAFGG